MLPPHREPLMKPIYLSFQASNSSNASLSLLRRVTLYLIISVFLLCSVLIRQVEGRSFYREYFRTQATKGRDQKPQHLEIGKPLERSLKGGESHYYAITLTTGQFLSIAVEQKGIDVVLRLFEPNDRKVDEVDSPNGAQGLEIISEVAQVSGVYRLEVSSLENTAPTGVYEVQIKTLRLATSVDATQVVASRQARRIFDEGEQLRKQRNADSIRAAIKKYEEALPLLRTISDKKQEAVTLHNLGKCYELLSDRRQALDYYLKALPLFQAVGARVEEAITLNNIAAMYSLLGEKRAALKYFEQVLPLRRQANDRAGEATTLSNIGVVYYDLGDKEKALAYFEQALPILRGLGESGREATTLSNMGAIYSSIGQKQKALEYYNQAVSAFKASKDLRGEATALTNMGLVFSHLGDIGKALEYFSQSLPIQERLGDRSGVAHTLINMGAVSDNLGEKQKALSYYERALELKRAIQDRHGESIILNNMGRIFEQLGEFHKALKHYNSALSLKQALIDRDGEATTLTNIGAVYDIAGEKDLGMQYYRKALAIFQDTKNARGQVSVLGNIGSILLDQEKERDALDYLNRALTLTRSIEDREGEATTLNNISIAYAALGEKQKALDYLYQALPIRRAIGDRSGEAVTLNNLGEIHRLLGDQNKALELFKTALPLRQATGDRSGEAKTLASMGRLFEAQEDFQQALDLYLKSIEYQEEIRTKARIEELKTRFAEHTVNAYERAILLSRRLGLNKEAFNLSERARARTFLDQLGNVHIDVHKSGDPRLAQELKDLEVKLSIIRLRLSNERARPQSTSMNSERSALEKELIAVEQKYKDLLTQLKSTNPEYASLRSVDTLMLSEVQALLEVNTTLISYFVTPSKTTAFVITKNSFHTVEVIKKESDLQSAVLWFRSFDNLQDKNPESLRELYKWLIAPLKPYLKGRKLCIIPHGILNYLPFAALSDGRRYLVDDYTLTMLPSASVLPFIIKKHPPGNHKMLVITNAKAKGLDLLTYADQEAEALGRLYPKHAVVNKDATEMAFRAQAGDYSILHIAAHGQLNSSSPLLSRIILGPDAENDGSLEVREVYELDLLNSELVTLSACDTQLGEHSRGDDIVGLNRAFIYAGAPTVVASLWSVDDKSTSLFMKSFYGHIEQGLSKAAALREAQRETRVMYPHPYYWAPFVLTGDGGKFRAAKYLLN